MSDLFCQRDNFFFAQADAQRDFDTACAIRDCTEDGPAFAAAQAKVQRLYVELLTAQNAYNYAVESGK
jgi:hypothetical protein